jgi:hypothetical protein
MHVVVLGLRLLLHHVKYVRHLGKSWGQHAAVYLSHSLQSSTCCVVLPILLSLSGGQAVSVSRGAGLVFTWVFTLVQTYYQGCL